MDIVMSLPLKALAGIVGRDRLSTEPEDLHAYGFDASKLEARPECVVHPQSTDQVRAIIRLANEHSFPVFPRGAGSGMVGAAVPLSGGVVLTFSQMNRILEIDPDNMIAVVQPGVVTGTLQRSAADHGLFYPPDPASLAFSTIGGNVAMGAGGPRAVKYGTTKDYVLGMTVVLPSGEVIRTGTRTVKGVVGFDLSRLLVGSEGCLGIFTEITLRLVPAPESVRTLTAAFPDLDDAARTVTEIIRSRILPSTVELLDQDTLRVVENHLHMGLPLDVEALLLIEVDGRSAWLDDDVGQITRVCKRCGASDVKVAGSEAEREQLWRARRSISPALGQIRPGKINEDVTVPRTKIPQLIRFIRRLAKRLELIIVCFGHAGDGNIHVNIMLDKSDRDEARRAERAVEELFRKVLDLGGTLSGEHGIGITKSPFLQWELGADGVDAMWRIKRALDPNNILNPGKMFVPNRAFFSAPAAGRRH